MNETLQAIQVVDRIFHELLIQKQVANPFEKPRLLQIENKFINALKKLFKEWKIRVIARVRGKVLLKAINFNTVEDSISIIGSEKLEALINEYYGYVREAVIGAPLPAQEALWFREYSKQLSHNITNRIKSDVSNTILYGMQKGLSPSEIATQLTDRFNKLEYYEAERIARTEYVRAYNESLLAGMEKGAMVDVSQHDPCEVCTMLASSYPKRKEKAMGDFPAHPNCRCYIYSLEMPKFEEVIKPKPKRPNMVRVITELIETTRRKQ